MSISDDEYRKAASQADAERIRRFEESINAVPDREFKPTAVFRVVGTMGETLVVDAMTDPVTRIVSTGDPVMARAVADLLNRHADEFCDVLDEIRNRDAF
jgi:hypothetical protein